MKMPKVIVLLPVYYKDSPAYLQLAVDSMLAQTYLPLDILIGIDGHVDGKLAQTIQSYSHNERITLLPFAENRGLAALLNDMIRWAQEHEYQYFARMDADDISLPERIEKQMNFLLNHPEIDAVGGATEEIDELGNKRNKTHIFPLAPDECYTYFAKRNPVAHPAVILRQTYFDKAGCLYRPEFRQNQDTMLWFDGLRNGARIANIADTVLLFRVTDDFFKKRRNGWEYAKGLLRERKIINRELHYGWKATVYAYLLFVFRISPPWLIRMAYKIF